MTKGLLDLPNECLTIILSMLEPSHIKRVALTFNRRLFMLTIFTIEKCLQEFNDNEDHFESIFGKIEDYGDPRLTKLSRHLEYLDLTGDLSWVDGLPLPSRPDEEPYLGVEEEEVKNFVAVASKLGLTVPPAFIKMARDPRCHIIFPGYVYVDPLAKVFVPSRQHLSDGSSSQAEEAYILTFREDSGTACGEYLYLDKAGRHAVLWADHGAEVSDEELNEMGDLTESDLAEFAEPSDMEKELGVVRGLPLSWGAVGSLLDINFEHWLQCQLHDFWYRC